MQARPVFSACVLALLAAAPGFGQLRLLPVPPYGPPAFSGPGRGRIVVVGSSGIGYGPYTRGFVYGPGAFGPYDLVEPRVSVQILVPAPEPRLLPEPIDLSGVDLDVTPPPWAKETDRPRHDRPALKPRLPDVVKPEAEKPKPPPPEEPKLTPQEQSKRLTALGMTAYRDQDYGLAAQKFNQAVDLDPGASRAYFLLGQAYFALGKYRDAVQMIGVGLGLEPNWPKNAFRPRFDLYSDSPENRQRHLEQLEDAVARQPNQAGYRFLLAYQYWFDDRRAEAVQHFRQVRPLVGDPALVDLFLKPNVQ